MLKLVENEEDSLLLDKKNQSYQVKQLYTLITRKQISTPTSAIIDKITHM